MVWGCLIALSIWPLARLVWVNISSGADTLSNDYLFFVPLVDKALNGTFPWADYFRVTFYNTHSYAFTFLIRLGIASLFHWSTLVEIYTGMAFAALQVILLLDMFSDRVLGKWKLLLLPVFSALVFAQSQASVFTFGDGALPINTAALGMALGVWVIVRRGDRWYGPLVAVFAGMMSTWGWGSGLISVPLFLTALVLTGNRKRSWYAALLLTGIAVYLPFFGYGIVGRNAQSLSLPGRDRLWYLFTEIGLLFAGNMNQDLSASRSALFAGKLGIVLAAVGGCIWLAGWKTDLFHKSVPGLIYLAWGTALAFQVSVIRSGLAPWYTATSLPFWIGIAGLAAIFAQVGWGLFRKGSGFYHRWIGGSALLWSAASFLGLAGLYIVTMLPESPYSFYLPSRSPASAACLFGYRSAPTYCEGLVFQWGSGRPSALSEMAGPLEAHGLSVFGPDRLLTLQGDFVLDTVTIHQPESEAAVHWQGPAGNIESAVFPDHLDLFLPAGGGVDWTVSLPSSAQNARFELSVRPSLPTGGFEGFHISAILPQGEEMPLVPSLKSKPGWQAINFDLSGLSGKTFTIRFQAASTAESAAFLLRFPLIRYRLSQSGPVAPVRVAPSNVDQAPMSVSDQRLIDLTDSRYWKLQNLKQLSDGSYRWNGGAAPEMELIQPLDFPARELDSISITLSASEVFVPRAVEVLYQTDLRDGYRSDRAFVIPLLADGGVHTYRFSLKHLAFSPSDRLLHLKINPLQTISGETKGQVTISKIVFQKTQP